MDDYKDIINVNWSDISFKHPRMTIYNRSGIFAPFSALSGYKEEIGETERVTDSKVELSEDYKDIINNKLINLDITDIDFDRSYVRCVGPHNKERLIPIGNIAIKALKEQEQIETYVQQNNIDLKKLRNQGSLEDKEDVTE